MESLQTKKQKRRGRRRSGRASDSDDVDELVHQLQIMWVRDIFGPSKVLTVKYPPPSVSHTPRYSQSELYQLYQKALDHVRGSTAANIQWLYRNKPIEHFEEIVQERNGIMEVYNKDHSGDSRSPINGRLQGLFFSTKVIDRFANLPVTSPFGNVRLTIPAEEFASWDNNLYFTDFYCTNRKHLVTLVVTKKGSVADKFCSSQLVKLPFQPMGTENPFFFESWLNGLYYCSKKVTVEVLYTEDVDLKEEVNLDPECLQSIQTTGRGTSVPDSKPKNPNCTICNL